MTREDREALWMISERNGNRAIDEFLSMKRELNLMELSHQAHEEATDRLIETGEAAYVPSRDESPWCDS